MVEAETTASHLVEAKAQLYKSLLDDCKAEEAGTDDNGLDDRSSSKMSQCNEKIEQHKSMAKISFAPGVLESGGEVQPRARVGVTPNRRGRKPNSLIKPDKVYEHTEGCKNPRIVNEYGEELIGSRIKVWWPMDSEFHLGVIDSFDPLRKKHKEKKASTKNMYKIKQQDDPISSEKRYPTRACKSGMKSAERSSVDVLV